MEKEKEINADFRRFSQNIVLRSPGGYSSGKRLLISFSVRNKASRFVRPVAF